MKSTTINTFRSSLLATMLMLPLSCMVVSSFQPVHPSLLSSPVQRHVATSHSTLAMSATDSEVNHLRIEYCTGCRWMMKSFWLAQEVLTTFENDLDSVTMVPSRPPAPGGVFRITINDNDLLWDRKSKGGFPSPKGLKQVVRDLVSPEQFLGRADTPDRQGKNEAKVEVEDAKPERNQEYGDILVLGSNQAPTPSVSITYCTGCKWLLRAAYYGQELLTTFADELNSVTLVPSKPPARGGRFVVALDGKVIFDRAVEGRFPEVKELKQMIRDEMAPSKDLGHSDVEELKGEIQSQVLSDEEAAAQRKIFGVE